MFVWNLDFACLLYDRGHLAEAAREKNRRGIPDGIHVHHA